MEKELKLYKKSLRLQTVFYSVSLVLLIIMMALSVFEVIRPVFPDERWQSMWNGFLFGLSVVYVVVSILGIIKNRKAQQNEAELKKMYIQTHDEREQAISRRCGQTALIFELVGLLFAIVIGGFFSPVVSFVCIGCLLYLCLVVVSLRIYFGKRM